MPCAWRWRGQEQREIEKEGGLGGWVGVKASTVQAAAQSSADYEADSREPAESRRTLSTS